MVGIEPADASVSGEDVLDAGFEGEGVFRKAEAGIEHSAGGIIEERQKHRLAQPALFIGNLHRVHPVCLHALKRSEEVELQVFLLGVLLDAPLPLKPCRAHQTRQEGGRGGSGDGS